MWHWAGYPQRSREHAQRIRKEINKRKLHPVLFIVIIALIGALIMSFIGEILYTLLFKLVTLFSATLQYSLDKIS